MLQTSFTKYKYNPNEIDEKEFLDNFVVRKDIFAEIFEDIKTTDYSIPSQHFILVGQRGQGKTTLLRKLFLEIRRDKELSKTVLPVQFAEEQYQIRSLCRLWEEVAEYLETIYKDEFGTVLDSMEKHFEDDDYDFNCFTYLEKEIKAKDKKIILLVDNIDELFGKLKDKEQRQLREILLSSSTFKIISGSTKMFEQQYDYAKPFYEFFKIVKLKGLDSDETLQLLRVMAKDEQKEKIEKIIKNQYAKIETLRQLTGGVPRTLVMLFDIFIDGNGSAFDDLLKILDEATPLYKHRMDDLPPVLQDIVHTLALNWDGMLTKDIALKTKLQSKEVSAQLKQLEKYQIVESVSIGKNNIYKIEERFFNIWYLMRYGRKKDRNRVEWLVRFLSSWYSKEELQLQCTNLIEASKNGDINENYLYHMSEALSYTGYLEIKAEHLLKESAKKYFEKTQSNYAKEMSPSDIEILKEAFKYQKNGNIEKAISLLDKSKKTSKNVLMVSDILHYIQKTEKYFLKAIENGDNNALHGLAWLYFKQSIKLDKALFLSEKSYNTKRKFLNTYIFSIILLWKEEFSKSYEKFEESLDYEEKSENLDFIYLYLELLIAKGQHYKAKELFEDEKYQLKDIAKPIWYALMTLMQDEFPNEIKKMGAELKESVEDVLRTIESMK